MKGATRISEGLHYFTGEDHPGLDRLRLGNVQINLALLSACTIFTGKNNSRFR